MARRTHWLELALITIALAAIAAHYVAVRTRCERDGGRVVRGAFVPFACVEGPR